MTTPHDPVCGVKPSDAIDAAKCWRCALVRKARQDERAVLLAVLLEEFPKPTLGVQKVLRIVRGAS